MRPKSTEMRYRLVWRISSLKYMPAAVPPTMVATATASEYHEAPDLRADPRTYMQRRRTESRVQTQMSGSKVSFAGERNWHLVAF
eukprot:scaffold1584_cov259-Pinguiococcus_pyrenoidosus.AAC.9